MAADVELLPEPKFGDWLRGIYASESNPTRDGMYVRTINRTGRVNAGKFYELTDGKGKFWQYPAKSTERLPQANSAQAAEIESLRAEVARRDGIDPWAVLIRAQQAEARAERLAEALRLAMDWNWLDDDARPSGTADVCDAALHPTAAQEAGND